MLENHGRFPTLLRLLPYQQDDLVTAMMLFLKTYNWTDVALFCDTNPALGNFFTLACSGFEAKISSAPGYSLVPYQLNSAKERDYSRLLNFASLRTRGTVSIC